MITPPEHRAADSPAPGVGSNSVLTEVEFPMRALTLPTSAVALLALGLTACASEETVQGECRDVFGGDICTWGTMVGDEVALASIENAPADAEMVFPPPFVGVVPLPPDVAAATGFDHLGVNWEPHGHPPGAFLTPHFDFHFYTIDPGRVGSIDCADLSKPADLRHAEAREHAKAGDVHVRQRVATGEIRRLAHGPLRAEHGNARDGGRRVG